MRINEIITESQELEEGWKSKLGAAALAGAAALGGGHQDAQAHNYSPPSAVMAKQNADFYQAAALHRLTKKEKSSIIEAAAFTRAVSAFSLKRGDKEASDHFGKISKDLTKISSLITANYEKLISARTSQIQKTDIKELQSQWRDSMENLKTVQTLIKDTLQQDLDEGWKSKLGAAALAGAAMLGGGHQDAQAQNYQPTAQSQQAPAKWHNTLNSPSTTYGTIGMLTPFYKAGKLSKDDSDLYNKMLRAFDKERQVNPNLKTDAINKYFGEKYSGSQQLLNKYANTPNKDFSPFTRQAIQTLRMLDKMLQQEQAYNSR